MTTTTPAKLGTFDAEYTATPIAAIGRHPITEQTETLWFVDDADLNQFLALGEGSYTVFDLNRATGEWSLRS